MVNKTIARKLLQGYRELVQQKVRMAQMSVHELLTMCQEAIISFKEKLEQEISMNLL